jgi:RsiW-degrading membrane proteinase PrsW (M82 family)
MILVLSVLLSFVPALFCAAFVYWIDRYEKEPRLLVGAVFFWGAVVAVLGALVSQLLLGGVVYLATGSEAAADLVGTTILAPLTEESLKGFAVLLVFLFLRREFDSLLDGLVYAGTVALGFAATENVFYLASAGEEKGVEGVLGLFVLRGILGAWDHAFYTSFIGIGLAAARYSRSTAVRWLAPPAGWAVAVGAHALHNGLATASGEMPELGVAMFLIDWSGWLFVGVVILVAVLREGKLLAAELAEEVNRGSLTVQQYQSATSSLSRAAVRLRALAAGRLMATRRFYQLCAELAHKKRQLTLFGDEGGNARTVEDLRNEIRLLSPQALS